MSQSSVSLQFRGSNIRRGTAVICGSVSILLAVIAGPFFLIPEEQLLAIILSLVMMHVFCSKALPTGQGAAGVIALALDLALIVVSAVMGVYMALNFEALLTRFAYPNTTDMLMGVLAIVVLLEATRRVIGWPLVILCLVALAYAIVGRSLPLLIAHKGYSFERITAATYLTREGMYGLPLKAMVRYVMVFMLFGSVLEVSGGGKFFVNLARIVAGGYTGGMAKVAALASAFMGSISGSAVANVATTGVITIPAMKAKGYPAYYAAAVEAEASSGGQVLPPVMGAAAFMMADFLGVPYAQVAYVALVPALLNYVGSLVISHLYCTKFGLKGEPRSERPALGKVLKEGGLFILPLVVITVVLIRGMSPVMAGLWGLVAAIVILFTRGTVGHTVRTLVTAVRNAGDSLPLVTVACGAAGIVVGMVGLTGFGPRLSSIIVDLSGGSLLILLLLTTFAAIIFGMGMPTASAYVVLATLIAPALVASGVLPILAHLFILYYGVFAMVTPPVALAAYAAAALADADANKTGWQAFLIASPAFVVPFMFVYNPALALIGSPLEIVVAIVTAVLGIWMWSGSIAGYLFGLANPFQRVLLMAGALLLMWSGPVTDLLGLAALALVVVWQLQLRKQTTRALVPGHAAIGAGERSTGEQ